MAQELGTGYVTIMPSTQGLEQNIQTSLGGAFDKGLAQGQGKFKSFFGTVAAGAAAVLATIGIGKIVKETIDAGVQFDSLAQSADVAFKTILGDGAAATSMLEKLDSFADTVPFDKASLIEGAQRLLAFGFAGDKIIPTLQAVSDAVAAVGGNDDTLNGVLSALSRIQATGQFTARTFLQLGNYGINAAQIIGDALGKTAQQVRAQVTSGAISTSQAFTALIDGMESKFSGAAAGLLNTWSGVKTAIAKSFESLGSELVAPFISPGGGGYLITWGQLVVGLLQKIDQSTAFKDLVGDVDEFGAIATPLVQNVFGKLDSILSGSGTGALAGAMKDLLPIVLPLAGALAATMSKFLSGLPILDKFLPALSGPVGIILGLVAGLLAVSPDLRSAVGGAFTAIATALEGVAKGLQPLMDGLLPAIDALAEALAGSLADAVRVLAPFIVQIVSLFGQLLAGALPVLIPVIEKLAQTVLLVAAALLPVVSEILSALLPVLTDLIGPIESIVTVFAKLISAILPVIAPLIGVLGKFIVGLVQAVLPLVSALLVGLMPVFKALAPILLEVVKAFTPLIKELLPPILMVVKALVPIILQLVQAFLPLLKPILSLIEPLVKLVGTILQPLIKLLGPILTPIVQSLGLVFGLLTPIISGAAKFLTDILVPVIKLVTNVLTDLINFISDVFQGKWGKAWKDIQKLFSDVWSGLENIGLGTVNGLIDLLNGLIGGLDSVLNGLKAATGGSVSLHIPKIPHVHLAASGTVKARPGGTLALLAEAGRDESVVDNGKLNDLMDAARSQSGVGKVIVQLLAKYSDVKLSDLVDARIFENDKWTAVDLDGGFTT